MKQLNFLKKKLYFVKLKYTFNNSLKNNKITEFDEEIFKQMSNTIIACLPVSIYIKYASYLFGNGTCYDRSLFMFLALDDALLVRGDNKDLEYNYGEGHETHGWVELDDYVYDPSLMLRFDKDTYYNLYNCTNVYKINKKNYIEQNKEFIKSSVSHDINEFKPNGKRRLELGSLIILVKHLCELIKDDNFTKDINDYLSLIEYDEKQIYEERNQALQKLLSAEIK